MGQAPEGIEDLPFVRDPVAERQHGGIGGRENIRLDIVVVIGVVDGGKGHTEQIVELAIERSGRAADRGLKRYEESGVGVERVRAGPVHRARN